MDKQCGTCGLPIEYDWTAEEWWHVHPHQQVADDHRALPRPRLRLGVGLVLLGVSIGFLVSSILLVLGGK